MKNKLFICIRPNHLQFALAAKKKFFSNIRIMYVYQKKKNFPEDLKKKYSKKIIFKFKNNLKNFQFKRYNQIYFPYTIDKEIFDLLLIVKPINKKKIKFFYDGIGSYIFLNKKFVKKFSKETNLQKDFKFPLKDFWGVKEYDFFFKRKTTYKSLCLNDIYKKKINSTKIFAESKRIFLGQPLPTSIISKKDYSKIIINIFKKKNLDTYVLHPLETKHDLKLKKK